MLRFIIDLFRFPFQSDTSENKFAEVINFVVRDFPSYFWAKNRIRKILFFPFIILYMIFRKRKYEKIWTIGQISMIVILSVLFFLMYFYKSTWNLDIESLKIFVLGSWEYTQDTKIDKLTTWEILEILKNRKSSSTSKVEDI